MDTTTGNYNTASLLGGREKFTLEKISKILGRETVDNFNTFENRGMQVSHGLNYQELEKELMAQDKLAVMDGDRCTLQVRGVRPFFNDKYDIMRHPNYKYFADVDEKNEFSVERYMKKKIPVVE